MDPTADPRTWRGSDASRNGGSGADRFAPDGPEPTHPASDTGEFHYGGFDHRDRTYPALDAPTEDRLRFDYPAQDYSGHDYLGRGYSAPEYSAPEYSAPGSSGTNGWGSVSWGSDQAGSGSSALDSWATDNAARDSWATNGWASDSSAPDGWASDSWASDSWASDSPAPALSDPDGTEPDLSRSDRAEPEPSGPDSSESDSSGSDSPGADRSEPDDSVPDSPQPDPSKSDSDSALGQPALGRRSALGRSTLDRLPSGRPRFDRPALDRLPLGPLARIRLDRLERRHVGLVFGLLLGAAVMLVVATLSAMTGKEVPVLSTLASAPVPDSELPIAERKPPPATPGSCLSWRRADAADTEVVDCAGPHLFEQAGAVQLTEFGSDSPMPGNDKFRQLVNDRCTPTVSNYLSGKYDPDGAFRAGALKPSKKSWDSGDRSLRCGLQRFSRSGALYPIVGKVSQQEQADIQQPGVCLGIDGRFIGDPVGCSKPHAVESVGFVDLGQKFKSSYPKVGDQDNYLQPACTKLADGYAGGDNVISSKQMSVLWDNLTPESWNAGTRKVSCSLAAQLPDKSGFAPIIGSVKGPVQVGNQPAPPAPERVPPGAPAAGSDSDANPDADGPPNGSGDSPQPVTTPGRVLPRPNGLPAPPSELPRPELPKLPEGGLLGDKNGNEHGKIGGRPVLPGTDAADKTGP